MVTSHAGNSARTAATAASPMIPAPTTSTGSPSRGGLRSRPCTPIDTGSCRLAIESGTASGIACSIERCASTWSAHPPPSPTVKPIDMPGVITRLPSSKQHDACPAAHIRHTGEMPRAAHGIAGSTATRVPTGTSQPAPGLHHRSRDLVTEQERERPEAAERRRAQRPVAEQVQVAPADAADRHRDARPLVVGELGLVDLDELGAELGILQVELDRSHGPTYHVRRGP